MDTFIRELPKNCLSIKQDLESHVLDIAFPLLKTDAVIHGWAHSQEPKSIEEGFKSAVSLAYYPIHTYFNKNGRVIANFVEGPDTKVDDEFWVVGANLRKENGKRVYDVWREPLTEPFLECMFGVNL